MELNRRQFVAGSALAGSVLASGAVAGVACADEAAQASTTSWRTRPEAIGDIAQTVEADVVVVGAGIGGVCATLKAVQLGAKTVCLQKSPYVLTHGGNFGAINTRFQAEAGNPEIDMMDILSHHLKYNNYRPQFEYAKVIFNESAETLEWIADSIDITWNPSKPSAKNTMDWDNTTFATGHTTDAGKAIDLANLIANKATELGAEFYFSTPGVDLVQDESGRVCGVIGKAEDGTYIQFNAAKGVILATGDYGSDYEMCAEMCPWVVGTHNYYSPRDNTGDGHKMGVWVGGKMETFPHTKMAHIHNSIDGSNLTDSPIKSDPFLWVNQDGKRFANEHMEYAMVCNTVREQPGDVFYIVIDSNYNAQRAARLNPAAKDVADEAMQTAIDLGYTVKGDTLEECAAAMDIPADALLETVARYNELAAAGFDEDFGKPAEDLGPIEQGPFYIIRTYTPMDVTMGGLMVSTKMEVLNEDDAPIAGLYAIGNTAGGFYGGIDYDLEVDAFSLGRAVTTGRLAAQAAMGE